MTVFEWLTTMTRNDFAHWVNWEYSRCDWCNPDLSDGSVNCGDKDCEDCIREWLDSPASEQGRVNETNELSATDL